MASSATARPQPEQAHYRAAEIIGKPPLIAPDNVLALQKRGKITPREAEGAQRWYRDYALGHLGLTDEVPNGGSGGGDAHTFQFARAKSKRACAEANAAVGRDGTLALIGFVGHAQTLEVVGASLGLGRKEAVGAVVATLRRLAEHYAADSPTITGPEAEKIRSAYLYD